MSKNKPKSTDENSQKTKKISITNALVRKLLFNSSNSSKLVEESILYFVDAIESGEMNQREVNRIFAQGLIKFK